MKNSAVLGLGFGDEGKGLIVNHICLNKPNSIVIRFSGGHQVGHTVWKKDKSHIFSNFGSGTFQNVPTFWDKKCTVDPVGLLKELEILKQLGLEPKIYINENCPVTTPYDKIRNITTNDYGSVGVGFGATIEREENFYSLKVKDLYNTFVFNNKLKNIIDIYYNDININGESLEDFKINCNKFIDCNNIKLADDTLLSRFDNYIYEGSQGMMLDPKIGFFPYVTRSNLVPNFDIDKIYLVTRAYCTRHGNGPMPNEYIEHNIILNENESNLKNQYQGEFRITLLDVSLLEYVLKNLYFNNSKFILSITCLDHIVNDYRFTYKNEIIKCKDKNDFIFEILNILKIDNYLISESNYSEKVIYNEI